MERIETHRAPAAIGPYSQGIVAGRFVFTSGQIGLDPEGGRLVAGGIEAEVRRALENVRGVLETGGAELTDVVRVTVFLKDMGDFPALNRVYEDFFGNHKPARSTVQVARLPKDAAVEIEATAFLG